MDIDYDAIQKAAGLMLEEVVLKAKRKSLLQELDERYTNGQFSGDANKVIDLVSSDDAMAYNNILIISKQELTVFRLKLTGLIMKCITGSRLV